MVPIVQAIRESRRFHPIVVSTGQHHRLVSEVLGRAGITPDVVLWAGGAPTGLNGLVAALLTRINDFCSSAFADRAGDDKDTDSVLSGTMPAAMLVHGDTSSAFSCALAGFHLRIPVLHVEAGLRAGTSNRTPFPEELNRRLISNIACMHLAPTILNAQNLIRERVPHEQIFVTGNTGIDALAWASGLADPSGDPRLEEILTGSKEVVVLTAHRRENWNGGLGRIGAAVAQLARTHQEVEFIAPLHPNPLVREELGSQLVDIPNVYCTEPLEYWTFARVLGRARFAITDSGGIQEEAPSLGTPVLVVRESTERIEGVEAGCLQVVGTRTDAIVESAHSLLTDDARHAAMAQAPNPYGDGKAAERIVQSLEHLADKRAPMPIPFGPGYDRSAVLRAAGYRTSLDTDLFEATIDGDTPSADVIPDVEIGGIVAERV
jgi:UDP-N-acetylglucosamine 2-epimerase (non-hydrolysing)